MSASTESKEAPARAISLPSIDRAFQRWDGTAFARCPEFAVWAVPLDAAWIPERGAGWLTSDEVASVERRRGPVLQRRARAARIALRAVLGATLGAAPEALRFVAGEFGKPALDPGGAVARPSRFDFNLSHSGGLALIATRAAGRVGVDVEAEREGKPLERISARWFAADEHAEWMALPPTHRQRAFYELWSCKESVLKAWGTGFSLSSRSFSVEPGSGGTRSIPEERRRRPRLRSAPEPAPRPAGRDEHWQIARLFPARGYAAAVCWEAEAEAASPRLLRWDD